MGHGKAQLDMIVGITSFGYVDSDFGVCSGDAPAIYTKVDYFLDWIKWIIDCHPEVRFDNGPSVSTGA